MLTNGLLFGVLGGLASLSLAACGDDGSAGQETTSGGSVGTGGGATTAYGGATATNSSSGGNGNSSGGSSGTGAATATGGTAKSTATGGSSAAKGGGASMGGNSSTTAPAGVTRGAASINLTQVQGCQVVGPVEMPNVASGRAVTASGVTQTVYKSQPVGTYFADATCMIAGSPSNGEVAISLILGTEHGSLTLAMDHVTVGKTESAGVTVFVDELKTFSAKSPSDTPCQGTPLQVSDTSVLVKITCSVLDEGGSVGQKCGLSEGFVYFDNCKPPS